MGGEPSRAPRRFALVVSRYHDFVTDRLETGARDALSAAGVPAGSVEVLHVPGAFEIPQVARRAASTGRFAGIVCLGCLIRGETPHFDVIAGAVANGITEAAADSGVPITFGVLTTNTVEEALARAAPGPANKGFEAAAAVLDMADLLESMER